MMLDLIASVCAGPWVLRDPGSLLLWVGSFSALGLLGTSVFRLSWGEQGQCMAPITPHHVPPSPHSPQQLSADSRGQQCAEVLLVSP